MPLTTLTVIRPEPLGDADAAQGWLAGLRRRSRGDRGRAGSGAGARQPARARRTGPRCSTPTSPTSPPSTRSWCGSGSATATSSSTAATAQAIEVPRSARRRRGEVLRPQERLAAVLAGRERVAACELLAAARARRPRRRPQPRGGAAARVALEALLAERDAGRRARAGRRTSPRSTSVASAPATRPTEALDGELTTERTRRARRDPAALRARPAPPSRAGLRGVPPGRPR